MFRLKFKDVRIESFGLNLAPNEVTSAQLEDRLAELYQRLGIPFGTLEKLTGVQTRRLWHDGFLPSQAATPAAKQALERVSFDSNLIGALMSCSITRDYFEPATACMIHNALQLPETAMVTDVGNACLGFMNGLTIAANLIETGVVKAALVASGETIERPLSVCLKYLSSNPDLDREQLLKLLPTLTLGSGGVAYVLAHSSVASEFAPKLVAATGRSRTKLNTLCNGNGDYFIAQGEEFNPIMTTEAAELISSAATLGGAVWPDLSELLGWSKDDVDHVFCHQVGKQVNGAFYREMGLDFEKEFTIYQRMGNLASAALPTALAIGSEEKQDMRRGDKVVLTGFGSGLNAMFVGLEW